jgi:hypothetical protein
MANAAADLAHTPTKLANSDAVALSVYLQVRVNKLLALLAVLCIECGGGLALAVGMALSDRPATECERAAANGARTVSTTPLALENAQAQQMPVVPGASGGSQQGEAPTRLKLLQMVTDATGILRTSERALGSRLGVSSTRARRLLCELVAAGAIKVRTSATGTTITLLAGGTA